MGAAAQGIDQYRWTVIQRTLIFIRHGKDVLLMKRALHKRAFPGMYNGLGGHVERDEDALTSARRELKEETGLQVDNLALRGVMNIDAGESTGIVLFVFTGSTSERTVIDSDEGTLEWIPLPNIEELPIVEDLPLLLARVFDREGENGAPFFAHVSFDSEDRRVTRFG